MTRYMERLGRCLLLESSFFVLLAKLEVCHWFGYVSLEVLLLWSRRLLLFGWFRTIYYSVGGFTEQEFLVMEVLLFWSGRSLVSCEALLFCSSYVDRNIVALFGWSILIFIIIFWKIKFCNHMGGFVIFINLWIQSILPDYLINCFLLFALFLCCLFVQSLICCLLK